MKRFQFRLERVLDYRNSVKKEKERELGLRQRNLADAEDTVATLIESSEKSAPTVGVSTMAEMTLQGEYQARLRELLVHQRLLVLEAAEAVEAARDAYLEKAIEAEAISTLKERQFEEFREEQRRVEGKAISDTVVSRYVRAKRSNGDEKP